jgi:hypothetical protein
MNQKTHRFSYDHAVRNRCIKWVKEVLEEALENGTSQ